MPLLTSFWLEGQETETLGPLIIPVLQVVPTAHQLRPLYPHDVLDVTFSHQDKTGKGRLKKNKPPVSTLMKSYFVLYGKEPLEV